MPVQNILQCCSEQEVSHRFDQLLYALFEAFRNQDMPNSFVSPVLIKDKSKLQKYLDLSDIRHNPFDSNPSSTLGPVYTRSDPNRSVPKLELIGLLFTQDSTDTNPFGSAIRTQTGSLSKVITFESDPVWIRSQKGLV